MSVIEKVKRRKAMEDKRYAALSAVTAIAELDPHGMQDLICHLTAYHEAAKAKDEEEQEYLLNAICEVFGSDSTDDEVSELDAWEQFNSTTAAGKAAKEQLDKEVDSFFAAYNRLKAAAGLRTIREVADAAGLSPTTVHAIEQQRVKPQNKTLQSLARAFKVDVTELTGR